MNAKLLILTCILLLGLNTFGQSVKGNWSLEDKVKAREAVEEVRDDVESALGDDTQKFIECYLESVENNYSSFADADADMSGCEKLATDCVLNMNSEDSRPSSSQKGNWSKEDMDKAQAAVDEFRSDIDEALGAQADFYIDCYLTKIENSYSSFYEADHDAEGCEELATDCMNELESPDLFDEGPNHSSIGSWTNDDLDLAIEEIEAMRPSIEEALGDDTDEYLECYLERVINSYANFDAANADIDGCTALARKCMDDIGL